MGVFDGIRNVAGGLYYSITFPQKKSFGVLQFLACADTLKLPYVTKDEPTCYFIQFSIKAMVCKAEFYFTHSV